MSPQATARKSIEDDQHADAARQADNLSKTLTAKNRVHTVVPATARAAREQVGLSLTEASRRAKLDEEQLRALEQDRWHPTYAQLDRLAEVYMVYSWVLQEQELPTSGQFDLLFPAFREFQGILPECDYQVRRVVARVESMRKLAMELSDDLELEVESFEPPIQLPQHGNISLSDIEMLADDVIRWLTLDHATSTFEQRRTAVEDVGVHVFLTSPHSHWSKIDRLNFRGLAVPKDLLPILALNGCDTEADRSFTLFHELAHLLLRQAAYDGHPVVDHNSVSDSVEIMCDRFAATVLWRGSPLEQLNAVMRDLKPTSGAEFERAIATVTQRWKLSAWSAAVRLHTIGHLSARQFRKLNAWFTLRTRTVQVRASRTDSLTGRQEVVRRFGRRYVATIQDAYYSGEMTLAKACLATELNVHQFLDRRR